LYILQICNTFSQEVILQETYEESHPIEHFIESAMDWHQWFIYDNQKRSLKGSYVKHSILKDGDDTIYKVFFNVRLTKLEESIS
jgi:hypothetical protein